MSCMEPFFYVLGQVSNNISSLGECYCCKAPVMFCGQRNFTQLFIDILASRSKLYLNFFMKFSLKVAVESICTITLSSSLYFHRIQL